MSSDLGSSGDLCSVEAETVTTPDVRMAGPTSYWWRKWLSRLGWERWFLVTVLRWLHEEEGERDDESGGRTKTTVEFTVPALARRLGMSENTLYRLLKSEKIEDGSRWRRLAVRENAKNPQAAEQVKMLRRFIPRLRYTAEYDEERGTTVRRGMAVELVLDDILTAPDAERMALPPGTTVTQAVDRGPRASRNRDLIGQPGAPQAAQAPDSGSSASPIPLADMHSRGSLIAETRASARAQTAENGNGGAQTAVSGKELLTDPPNQNDGVPARGRACSDLHVLKRGLPIQPVGINFAVAFNLALDKALALLPDLQGADSGLYTLAAELHTDAQGQPSRAWPDAGGAGWVLDAVQDALGAGQTVRSVRLIRVITDRWRLEGNPYAASAPRLGDGSMDGGDATEQALAATWRVAAGDELDPEALEQLRALVGSGPGQRSLDKVLATINEIGQRSDRALRPADIGCVLAGVAPMPAAVPEPIPETIVAEAKPAEPEQDAAAEDPVLGRVTAWYLSAVSARMTALTAEELRDLTDEQRNLDVWQYAFERAKHIGNSLGRWQYVRKVVMNPDMERVEHWLQSGKREFHSKGERNGGGRGRRSRGRQGGSKGDRWTRDDV